MNPWLREEPFPFAIRTLQPSPLHYQDFTYLTQRKSRPKINILKTLHRIDGRGSPWFTMEA